MPSLLMTFGISLNTWEDTHARGIFSHSIADPYVMHVIPLEEIQLGSISYEYPYTLCDPVSYDYCYSFDHDVDFHALLSRPQRLDVLTIFNKRPHFHDLLKIDLSLGSPIPKVRPYEGFDAKSEAPIPWGMIFMLIHIWPTLRK